MDCIVLKWANTVLPLPFRNENNIGNNSLTSTVALNAMCCK